MDVKCYFQARRSFEKEFDKEDLYDIGTDYFDQEDPFIRKEPELVYKIWLAKTYFYKWSKKKEVMYCFFNPLSVGETPCVDSCMSTAPRISLFFSLDEIASITTSD